MPGFSFSLSSGSNGVQKKKYGLQVPKTKKKIGIGGSGFSLALGNSKMKTKSNTKALGKSAAVFGNLDDDEDNDTSGLTEREATNLRLVAEQKKVSKKQKAERALALAQDADVYEYDKMYDGIQAGRQQAVEQQQEQKVERKSKYIDGLLNHAKDRERWQSIVYERKLRKEREADEHLYGDKEKFVTQAYREKLIEDRRWEEEEERKAAKTGDVTKTKSMTGFLSNLLNSGTSRSHASALIKQEAETKEEEGRKKEEEEEKRQKRQEHSRSSYDEVVDVEKKIHSSLSSSPSSLVSTATTTENNACNIDKRHSSKRNTDNKAPEPKAKRVKDSLNVNRTKTDVEINKCQNEKKIDSEQVARVKEKMQTEKKMSARERFLARKAAKQAQSS